MNVIRENFIEDVSRVYVAQTDESGGYVEFVDVEPEIENGKTIKWVTILSTQVGCPVSCSICDAGYTFKRNLSKEEILFQIEYIIKHRKLKTDKIGKMKIQFARMGEPSLNDQVIDAMIEMKKIFPDYIPCVATIAPQGADSWFERILEERDKFFDFQLQFSIITSNERKRDDVIKYAKKDFYWISEYGRAFYRKGKRMAVLNFPVNDKFEIDAVQISKIFDPRYFIIKLTPLNPTEKVKSSGEFTDESNESINLKIDKQASQFACNGFSIIKSIGNMTENVVGSNCGQSVVKMIKKSVPF